MDGDNKLVDSKTDQRPAETSGRVTTMASSKYQYDNLPSEQHIRIATILAGKVDEPLRCRVGFVPLDALLDLTFEAISYVWGDENDTTTIEVETPEGSKSLAITRNLAAGLRRFRYTSRTRTL